MSSVSHRAVAGGGGGYVAFYFYPDDDLSVSILTNLQGSAPESFIDEVAGYLSQAFERSTSAAVSRQSLSRA